MKKPSKEWKEFGQIIDIVDIRIGKQIRKLDKLRKALAELDAKIQGQWNAIEYEQNQLKNLVLVEEINAISRLFQRRESIKSTIESLFFEVSISQQEKEQLEIEIQDVEQVKRELEKRKDALTEMRAYL